MLPLMEILDSTSRAEEPIENLSNYHVLWVRGTPFGRYVCIQTESASWSVCIETLIIFSLNACIKRKIPVYLNHAFVS